MEPTVFKGPETLQLLLSVAAAKVISGTWTETPRSYGQGNYLRLPGWPSALYGFDGTRNTYLKFLFYRDGTNRMKGKKMNEKS